MLSRLDYLDLAKRLGYPDLANKNTELGNKNFANNKMMFLV